MTPEGKESVKAKLKERMTVERRRRFSKETKESRMLAEETRKKAADDFAQKYITIIKRMQRDGLGMTAIAAKLNNTGHTSRRGLPWTDQTVRQVLKRIDAKITAIKTRDISSEIFGSSQTVKRKITGDNGRKIIGWRQPT